MKIGKWLKRNKIVLKNDESNLTLGYATELIVQFEMFGLDGIKSKSENYGWLINENFDNFYPKKLSNHLPFSKMYSYLAVWIPDCMSTLLFPFLNMNDNLIWNVWSRYSQWLYLWWEIIYGLHRTEHIPNCFMMDSTNFCSLINKFKWKLNEIASMYI